MKWYFLLDAILFVVIFRPWRRMVRAYVGASIMWEIVGNVLGGALLAGLFWVACVVVGG